ncbi:MAG: UDP-2,3-diacylglucosamine diphosphatase LpxI [Rhodospirillaceae bacterium]|nr:UDP-2,3-diacylglucosamine diphosphatase LpxI [Rhodospirillaceae bacterium]
MTQTSIALLAGGGDLPRRLIHACRTQERPVFVVAFRKFTDPETVEDVEHAWTRLGAAGQVLEQLAQWAVEEVCLAGQFRRPGLMELAPDGEAMRILMKVGWRSLGDAGLMDALAGELEERGFRVVAPQDILGGLLSGEGCYTRTEPDDEAWVDIARGREVARILGTADAGQGVVVQQGVVLAIEAAEGTDAMLARCGDLRREGLGGVLVKARRPQQDERVDLPTIGTGTVRAASAAGLRGIAVEAGGAVIVDRDALVELADELGLFVIGLPADEPESP